MVYSRQLRVVFLCVFFGVVWTIFLLIKKTINKKKKEMCVHKMRNSRTPIFFQEAAKLPESLFKHSEYYTFFFSLDLCG